MNNINGLFLDMKDVHNIIFINYGLWFGIAEMAFSIVFYPLNKEDWKYLDLRRRVLSK